jgi:signal transduction histidine kinase
MTTAQTSIASQDDELADRLPAFVVVLNAAREIVLWNRHLESVTGFTRVEMLGRDGSLLIGNGGDRRLDIKGGGHRLVRWHLADDPPGTTYAFGMDVTEERDELRQSMQKERLTAAGTLAAGLAHEVRNPLNSATLQLQVLRRRIERGQSAREQLLPVIEIVEGEMARLERLVNDFLAFAQPRRFELESVSLNGILEEELQRCENIARTAGIRIERALDAALGPVEVDPHRLRQALTNLFQNAIEAMPTGGTLSVRSSRANAQGFVHVEIEDSGVGFAEDAPLFDAFYTTKSGGTGLGLSIAHKIVSEHGGILRAEPRNPGACFFVLLPQLHKSSVLDAARNDD